MSRPSKKKQRIFSFWSLRVFEDAMVVSRHSELLRMSVHVELTTNLKILIKSGMKQRRLWSPHQTFVLISFQANENNPWTFFPIVCFEPDSDINRNDSRAHVNRSSWCKDSRNFMSAVVVVNNSPIMRCSSSDDNATDSVDLTGSKKLNYCASNHLSGRPKWFSD